MTENANEHTEASKSPQDAPPQTANIAFAPAEMIACGKCARSNPPHRLKCFYCAADLPLSADRAARLQLNARKLEDWEKGFNLIYEPLPAGAENLDVSSAAKLLRLDADVLRRLVEAQKSLPLARVESANEAEIIAAKLRENNLSAVVVSDETLNADVLPTRLRGAEFGGDRLALVLFNTSEIREIRREDLLLIVSGAVFERRTEALERRQKGENKLIDASEIASDDSLIDIYSRGEPRGYRISAKGFDFSSLETEKSIIAAENMKKFAAKLRAFAPDARFDDDYRRVRDILSVVWEIENKRESQGLRRRGFGKLEFSSATISSNLQQFTKYSRLRRQTL